jgi:hypothetical protein
MRFIAPDLDERHLLEFMKTLPGVNRPYLKREGGTIIAFQDEGDPVDQDREIAKGRSRKDLYIDAVERVLLVDAHEPGAPSLDDVAFAFEDATGEELVVDLTDLNRLVVRLDSSEEDLVVAHDVGELVTELLKAANARGVQI